MDVSKCALPPTINPNNFPAKLWRLVNNPAHTSISWDNDGEGILIHKQLFERRVLSPSFIIPDNADTFKTSNFSSFVRQLNLYGFRKVEPVGRENQLSLMDAVEIHHFFNPNFKRNHPELVLGLRRLTADNKARLKAGEDIHCRPPGKRLRFRGPDERFSRPRTVHFGTPIPPRYLIRGHGAVPSPSIFSSDKGTQVTFNTQHARVASSSNAMHVQPGLLAHGNHGRVQCQQGYFYPGYQCYQVKQTSQIALSGLPPGLFPSQSFYQGSHTFNMFVNGNHSQELLEKEHQEMKKACINLDTVFQIAEDVMPPPFTVGVVEISTPEKSLPVVTSTLHTCSPSSTQKTPPSVRLSITAVSGNADQVNLNPPEISMDMVPEQLLKVTIP